MNHIPVDYVDMLYWVRDQTEAFWKKKAPEKEQDRMPVEWIRGARWIGLSDADIDEVERKYNIQFMPEHRLFLRVLHAIDRAEKIPHEKLQDGKEITVMVDQPLFYNWLTDDELIRQYFEWPYQTIFQDVFREKPLWLHSWGNRPDSIVLQRKIISNWVSQAPPLIPLTGHRFLVSDRQLPRRPVLSVWGAEIEEVGADLHSYLLQHFASELGFPMPVSFNEYKQHYDAGRRGSGSPFPNNGKAGNNGYKIPFWSEFIDRS